MSDLDQQIIKFDYEKSLKYDDFYVSKSNEHIFKLINNWPKWEKILLISVEKNFQEKLI